jgi:hypothetical protein
MEMKFRATREGRELPEQTIDFDALSKEQVAWLVQRGIEESARNSYASETVKKHGGEEKAHVASVQAWNSWFNRLRAGEVMSGGGGRTLSSFERVLRQVVAAWFEQRGLGATDAQKAARTPAESVKAFIVQAADAKGITDEARIEAAFTKQWDELHARAELLRTPDDTIEF